MACHMSDNLSEGLVEGGIHLVLMHMLQMEQNEVEIDSESEDGTITITVTPTYTPVHQYTNTPAHGPHL